MNNYFLYDPDGDGFITFATAEERNECVTRILDAARGDGDEWDSGLEYIRVGIITGRVECVCVEKRPPDSELDENDCDEDGTQWPDGINERYGVRIVPTELPEPLYCRCGDLIGYVPEGRMGLAQAGAVCGKCAVLKLTEQTEGGNMETELRDLLDTARDLLIDKHEPDQGQLRTQWDQNVDEWLANVAPFLLGCCEVCDRELPQNSEYSICEGCIAALRESMAQSTVRRLGDEGGNRGEYG